MNECEWREAGNFFGEIASDYWYPLVALHDASVDEMTRFVLVATSFDETITEHWGFDDARHGDENLSGANVCLRFICLLMDLRYHFHLYCGVECYHPCRVRDESAEVRLDQRSVDREAQHQHAESSRRSAPSRRRSAPISDRLVQV